MRGKACSAEFTRRIDRMVEAAGGLEGATRRGALRPLVQLISHQTCLKETQVYQLLRARELRLALEREFQISEIPQPSILIEALAAPEPDRPELARRAIEEEWTAEQVRIEAARLKTAASNVDEAKDIRDKALAVAAYARQAQDRDLITWASEIKLRAERRTGELLREIEKPTGDQYGGRHSKDGRRAPPSKSQPRLKDLGISHDQSSDWQKLAAIPEPEFERRLKAAAEKYPEVAAPIQRAKGEAKGARRQA
jgi:hypothetical protein